MGSDRKPKEKKSKRKSYSSDSQDEGKTKRARTVEDEETKKRKSDKKEKRKDKKSHKHSKHHSEKKSKDKHSRKHHKGVRNKEFQELSAEDYFSKNNEFATWLKEEKNVFFSDLSSDSARELFSDFVKAWNREGLESRYYDGITTAPRTSHNWKIRGKKK